MDARPIGVFDSGVGGLTAVRSLRQLLPGEKLIYFGDTARMPYGSRSPEEILELARQDVRFLRSFGPKAIVIACGTITTTSLDPLRQENCLPIVGVVEPACRRAAEATKNGRIGVIATEASIRSGAYEAALRRLAPAAEVLSRACPRLASLVEGGHFRPGDELAEAAVHAYLAPLREAGVDTLLLGCTHYPLLADVIGAFMGPGVTLVSAGEEAARELKRMIASGSLQGAPEARPAPEFYVSGRPEDFERVAQAFLQEDLRPAAGRIDIERYGSEQSGAVSRDDLRQGDADLRGDRPG